MLTDLYSYLITAPGVGADPTRAAALTSLQAIVVTSASPLVTKVYPDFLSERQTNAIVYQLIDGTHGYILDGTPISIEYPRVQIDVYCDDPVTRELMGGYVITALDGFIGTMGGTTVGMLVCEDTGRNTFEADSKQYRKTLDFKVIHYS